MYLAYDVRDFEQLLKSLNTKIRLEHEHEKADKSSGPNPCLCNNNNNNNNNDFKMQTYQLILAKRSDLVIIK